MATSATCYGGVGEIGGNKLLLEDAGRRVMFDFGKAFGRYGDYFDGVFIKERVTRGLLDPLALGLVPPLRGLLREDLVPVLDPNSWTSPRSHRKGVAERAPKWRPCRRLRRHSGGSLRLRPHPVIGTCGARARRRSTW